MRFEIRDEYEAAFSGFVCSWLAETGDDVYQDFDSKFSTQALDKDNMKKLNKNNFNHGFFD